MAITSYEILGQLRHSHCERHFEPEAVSGHANKPRDACHWTAWSYTLLEGPWRNADVLKHHVLLLRHLYFSMQVGQSDHHMGPCKRPQSVHAGGPHELCEGSCLGSYWQVSCQPVRRQDCQGKETIRSTARILSDRRAMLSGCSLPQPFGGSCQKTTRSGDAAMKRCTIVRDDTSVSEHEVEGSTNACAQTQSPSQYSGFARCQRVLMGTKMGCDVCRYGASRTGKRSNPLRRRSRRASSLWSSLCAWDGLQMGRCSLS